MNDIAMKLFGLHQVAFDLSVDGYQFPTLREQSSRTPHGRAMADEFGRGYPRAQAE